MKKHLTWRQVIALDEAKHYFALAKMGGESPREFTKRISTILREAHLSFNLLDRSGRSTSKKVKEELKALGNRTNSFGSSANL